MKKIILIFLFVAVIPASVYAQVQNPVNGNSGEGTELDEVPAVKIKQSVKNWYLKDDFTFADTVQVDTITTGVQIHNPIYRISIANVYTGNLGSPYQSEIISDQRWRNQFIFYNSLQYFIPFPEDVIYFNTRTPYSNIWYSFGSPKRRAEESVGAMFTQNVNKNFNVGLKYTLYSPMGLYDAQKLRNQHFRLFSSYTGKKYSINAAFLFSVAKQMENGGIINDDFILNPDKYQFDQPENIPVNFTTALNHIKNYQLFVTQSFGLGSIKVKNKKKNAANDSVDDRGEAMAAYATHDSLSVTDEDEIKAFKDSLRRDVRIEERTEEEEEYASLPVSTIFYTMKIENDRRVYSIKDLPQYMPPNMENPYYTNIFVDSLQTRDSVKYNDIENTFQLKFNEEANSLLKFGVRFFISNAIRIYTMPAAPYYDPDDREYTPHYRRKDTTLVTSYLGAQIFKNLGENFWWNAGIKFFFQGYRVGDTELTGMLNSRFKITKKDTAGIFADGGFYVVSPELFQNTYFSNHIKWNNNFNAEKSFRIRGGIRIPTRRLELSAEFRSITDHIYWNNDALPAQEGGFVQVLQLTLNKHFIWARVHNIYKLVYQKTSNPDVLPLPDFAGYTSLFYENILFKVLTFQIGFDLRYHTNYYAPTYMPATGQFHTQNIRKTGNYPFFDVFLNFQLKRARIYVKLDHANQGLTGNNYFLTVGYPANPRSVKFGISWNFYN